MALHDCPECGLPAEAGSRFVIDAVEAPVECAAIRCVAGHHLRCPVEFLDRSRHDHASMGIRPTSGQLGRGAPGERALRHGKHLDGRRLRE